MGLRAHDGLRGPQAGDRRGRAGGQLRRGATARHYPVLYAGDNGLVAHECILDLRPLTRRPGSPSTTSPSASSTTASTRRRCRSRSPGTLMVEPTETEDLAEIDRFIDAMIAIKAEADAVARGGWPADDNPLVTPRTRRSRSSRGSGRTRTRARRRSTRCRAGAHQVLAAGAPHRPGLRRPQPGLRLPAARGLRLAPP